MFYYNSVDDLLNNSSLLIVIHVLENKYNFIL
jgi:hypothetical protein